MIIKDAKRYMDLPPEEQKATRPSHPCWDYIEMKVRGKIFCIVFEFHKAWGQDGIRQWMIDGNTESGVPWRYPDMKGTVEFDCANGMIGNREFENGSLTWEFLYKPLGLHWLDIAKVRPYALIGRHELKALLTANNIGFEIIKEGRY